MPKKEQTIPISNLSKEEALAIAYEAFKNLGWRAQFAGPDKLLGSTPKKFTSNAQQIIIGVDGNTVAVSSELVNNELFDLGGKNKKNIDAFSKAFDSVKNNIEAATVAANITTINDLRQKTERVAEEEARHSAEVDVVMNLSKSNLYVTYGIIVINVLVFIAMAVSGVSIFAPTGIDIIKWGADFGPLTVSGEWWRLITHMFVHIGIIHIAFNMYALYMVGIYLEPMLGKMRYTAAYITTGIFSGIASLWWHTQPVASAGASGAIFGMYGVFLALLITDVIPKAIRKQQLQSILIFVGYNLIYGIQSGIDNAAHIGGLVSGLVIGFIFYLTLTKQVFIKNITAVCISIIIAAIACSYAYIQNSSQKLSSSELSKLHSEIHAADFKDTEKYNDKYNEIIALQDEAIIPVNDPTGHYDEILSQKLTTISTPKWQKAEGIINEMITYEVDEKLKAKARVMELYIHQRKEEIAIIQRIIKGDVNAPQQLDSLRNVINGTVNKLQGL